MYPDGADLRAGGHEMKRRSDDLRDRVKSTVTMAEALNILGFEPPNRSHKIHSLQNPGERTPSLHVYDQSWYDYSTGEGGDVIDFAMKARGLTYHEALERLSGQRLDPMNVRKRTPAPKPLANLTETFVSEPWASPEGYRQAETFVSTKWPYLTLDDVLGFDVKATETELWVPHTDSDGIIRGIKRRTFKNGSKYAVTGSTFTSQLYRVRFLLDTALAVLVEGESDLWCVEKYIRSNDLHRLVFVYALPSGAATWRSEWRDQLAQHRHTFICLDDDLAGHQAAKRIIGELPSASRINPLGGRVAEAIETADKWLAPRFLEH